MEKNWAYRLVKPTRVGGLSDGGDICVKSRLVLS